MPDIKILSEQDLQAAVKLDLDAIDCIENAFNGLAVGGVVMPPILSMAIPDANGEVDVKTAYVPGIESFAIKISPGFFDNPKLGLPSTSGLMVLFSATTGMVEAVLLDNGYLTDVRTAAAGAVAARHLSREGSRSAFIFGAGVQARLQLLALTLVRPIERAVIWAREKHKAEALAARIADERNIDVTAVSDPARAVADSDIVVTTTPSAVPLFNAGWLRPGQHVTAMGSDQDHKNELDPACFLKASHYVADRTSQTEKLGELRSALMADCVPIALARSELSDVVAGNVPGREHEDDITIADLTGTGIQDTAIATFARTKALALGAGISFTS